MPLPTTRPKKPMKLPPKIDWSDPSLQPQKNTGLPTGKPAAEILRTLDLLRDPTPFLALASDATAADCLALLARLRVNQYSLDPLNEAAAEYAGTLSAGDYGQSVIRRAVASLLYTVADRLTQLVEAGPVEGLIRSADFTDYRTVDSGMIAVQGGSSIPYIVGILSSLPADHPARNLLPESEQYLESRRPNAFSLVLGLADRNGRPRPWYLAADAVRLTQALRSKQIREAQELARQQAEQERKAALEFWASPLGQQIQRDQLAKEMVAAGKVPAMPEIPPAILINGGPPRPPKEQPMPTPQDRASEFINRVAGSQPTAPQSTVSPPTERMEQALGQPAPKRENARPGDRTLTEHAAKQ